MMVGYIRGVPGKGNGWMDGVVVVGMVCADHGGVAYTADSPSPSTAVHPPFWGAKQCSFPGESWGLGWPCGEAAGYTAVNNVSMS